jgi:hypothetical protein
VDLFKTCHTVIIIVWILEEVNCTCVSYEQCQWSVKAINDIENIPNDDPRKREEMNFFQTNICNNTERWVYCCGSNQGPKVLKDENGQDWSHEVQKC